MTAFLLAMPSPPGFHPTVLISFKSSLVVFLATSSSAAAAQFLILMSLQVSMLLFLCVCFWFFFPSFYEIRHIPGGLNTQSLFSHLNVYR